MPSAESGVVMKEGSLGAVRATWRNNWLGALIAHEWHNSCCRRRNLCAEGVTPEAVTKGSS